MFSKEHQMHLKGNFSFSSLTVFAANGRARLSSSAHALAEKQCLYFSRGDLDIKNNIKTREFLSLYKAFKKLLYSPSQCLSGTSCVSRSARASTVESPKQLRILVVVKGSRNGRNFCVFSWLLSLIGRV